MEFIKIHSGKLKIALTAEELAKYNLTPATLDYRNEETRQALQSLLAEAKRLCGFDTFGEAIYVEVYPSRTGACEIFICCLESKSREELTVYPVSFEDSEAMIAASAALLAAGYCEKSYLYRLCGRFYLILFSLRSGDALLTLSLAYEFGSKEKGSVYDTVRREGQLLSENAVPQLGEMVLRCREKPSS